MRYVFLLLSFLLVGCGKDWNLFHHDDGDWYFDYSGRVRSTYMYQSPVLTATGPTAVNEGAATYTILRANMAKMLDGSSYIYVTLVDSGGFETFYSFYFYANQTKKSVRETAGVITFQVIGNSIRLSVNADGDPSNDPGYTFVMTEESND